MDEREKRNQCNYGLERVLPDRGLKVDCTRHAA